MEQAFADIWVHLPTVSGARLLGSDNPKPIICSRFEDVHLVLNQLTAMTGTVTVTLATRMKAIRISLGGSTTRMWLAGQEQILRRATISSIRHNGQLAEPAFDAYGEDVTGLIRQWPNLLLAESTLLRLYSADEEDAVANIALVGIDGFILTKLSIRGED